MNKSKFYDLSVKNNSLFQTTNKTWSGWASVSYVKQLKDIVNAYDIKTLLDYGCGKGKQYTEESIYDPALPPMTLDKYLGVDVYKYDPCVKEFDILPSAGTKFDAVILIQVLPFIPDDDLAWVNKLLMTYTNKVCFIGQADESLSISRKKQSVMNPEWFKETRTNDWYIDRFKDWAGSDLVWWFRDRNSTYIENWLKNDIRRV